MILQALKSYYDRKAADADSGIAPPGWEWKEIAFVILLNADGEVVNLENTRQMVGKKEVAQSFLAPQSVKKTSGVAANLLWDNTEYVLGLPKERKGDNKSREEREQRTLEQHTAFVEKIKNLPPPADGDEGMRALLKFLAKTDKVALLEKFGAWQEMVSGSGNISFRLVADSGLLFERPAVREAVNALKQTAADGEKGLCLVTGSEEIIERLHPSIKGVWGAQTSGANIVSFNQTAFCSYGKEQGSNAPVGSLSAFVYTTALNHLLGKNSRQRLQVGDASAVFWSERSSELEDHLTDYFGEPVKDDPDRQTRAVAALYTSIENGSLLVKDDGTRFFVLGLSPNASRLAVRFWCVATVREMSVRIVQYFADIKIVHADHEPKTLSLFRLLVSTAVQGKSENIIPNLAGETMRAILNGTPYPATLLMAAVRRIRADHDISYPRVALIKACLNRPCENFQKNSTKEMQVSLDIENKKIGYRLGRLFAALEKIQEEAQPGINATIRDRFYGAASGAPASVFSTLIKLSKNHLSKLGKEKPGREVWFEQLLMEIISEISDFPATLDLADQGRFAIGYYHQRSKLFEKKETKEKSTENKKL
ncbi:MAG: type I-C CRISPR-associated protein Cas8c/Csd1 [Verrucomicrobiales bacterium]|jgi:CRISPR-associated protein Csd1|nr:type I-C CRISPR-associated protein Cas8c/Csd1 [Verrucomicrobiales bacterium]